MMWKLIIIASCFSQLLADRPGNLADLEIDIGGGSSRGRGEGRGRGRGGVNVDVDIFGGGRGKGRAGAGVGAGFGNFIDDVVEFAEDFVGDAANVAKDAVKGAGRFANNAVKGVRGVAKNTVGAATRIVDDVVDGTGKAIKTSVGLKGRRPQNVEIDVQVPAFRPKPIYAKQAIAVPVLNEAILPRRLPIEPVAPIQADYEPDEDFQILAALKQRESYRHQYQKSAVLPMALELVGDILDNPGNVGDTIMETLLTGKKKAVAPNTAATSKCVSSIRSAVYMKMYEGEKGMDTTPVSEVMETDCPKDCQPIMDYVPREVLDGIMCTNPSLLNVLMSYAEDKDNESYEEFYHPISLGFLNTLLGGLLGGVTKAVTDTASTVTGTVLSTATGAVNKALKTGADLVDSTAGTALNAAGKAVKTVGNAAGKAVDTVGNVADKAIDLAGTTADQALDLGKKVGKGALGAANKIAG